MAPPAIATNSQQGLTGNLICPNLQLQLNCKLMPRADVPGIVFWMGTDMLFNPAQMQFRADCQPKCRPDTPSADAHVTGLLKKAGLRATRQRQVLGTLLFMSDHRRVTADDLYREALDAGVPLSLATVYNTLNQFVEGGFVRRVSVNGERTYFDTDSGDHHHFYVEAEDRLMDIPAESVRFCELPEPPAGYAIDKVDVVVHLKKVDASTSK